MRRGVTRCMIMDLAKQDQHLKGSASPFVASPHLVATNTWYDARSPRPSDAARRHDRRRFSPDQAIRGGRHGAIDSQQYLRHGYVVFLTAAKIACLIVGLSLEPVPIAVLRLAGNRGATMTALKYQRRRLLGGGVLPAVQVTA
jgi:hypothetical protein